MAQIHEFLCTRHDVVEGTLSAKRGCIKIAFPSRESVPFVVSPLTDRLQLHSDKSAESLLKNEKGS